MFVIQLCQFKLTPSACKRHQSIVFIDILAFTLHVLIVLTYAKRKTLQHHKCYFDMSAVLMLIWDCTLISMMHSPEVELTEIFLSNIFYGNGLVPSDIAPDTKNTSRRVHKFRILKIL